MVSLNLPNVAQRLAVSPSAHVRRHLLDARPRMGVELPLARHSASPQNRALAGVVAAEHEPPNIARFVETLTGELPMGAPTRFDRAYFDRWYRDPRRRVLDRSEISRRAALVVSVAEYALERPVRSALDLGCGEGNWRAPLLARRPRLRYVGVDASEYVVRRYGRRRNIMLGTAESLDTLPLRGPFDVVIASGVLNFLSEDSLQRAARTLSRLTSGIAFLELFTSADDVVGDTRGWRPRSAGFYRRVLQKAGFTQCGPHCYAVRSLAGTLAALERAE